MSTVELAVKKVRKLSAPQAKAWSVWIDKYQTKPKRSAKSRHVAKLSTLAKRKKALMDFYDSVRGTTDWEPPRMPDDLVDPSRL